MAGVEIGDFGSPDETRTPDKTTVEIERRELRLVRIRRHDEILWPGATLASQRAGSSVGRAADF